MNSNSMKTSAMPAEKLPYWFEVDKAQELLRYGKLLSSRGLIVNTLGNIALRRQCTLSGKELIYTKHQGVSLEESDLSNISVLDLETDVMIHGEIRPSVGHQMHREIMRCRDDINATIHLHPNSVISYFSVFDGTAVQYVSNDTAMVLGMPPAVLSAGLNVELDVSPISKVCNSTNCIVMPGHGITAFGRTLSEAYHRSVSFVAEIERLIQSYYLSLVTRMPINFASGDEIKLMYAVSDKVIYGDKKIENF